MSAKPRLMPPAYFFIFLALSIALHFFFPVKKVIFPPYTYLGFLMIAFGAVLNLWADYLLKKWKTTVKPHLEPAALVESGPFRLSRNPQYLGFAAILLGVAFLHGTIITFVFPIAFAVAMQLLFIPLEEKNMENAFGKKYLEYKKKTRRWI